jgi:aspartate--ammonia ligase
LNAYCNENIYKYGKAGDKMKLIIPDGYHADLGIKETEIGIKYVKDFFERELAKQLNLTRVSAPLFVRPETGLNDNLNGIERPVSFGVKEQNEAVVEIVQSLAKWKRQALKRYGFAKGEGLYTDMSAIRRDEETDNLHSIYVDQWDWEKVIDKNERNLDTLMDTVRKVYTALKNTENYMASKYDYIKEILPKEIFFVTSQELEDKYPTLTPKERENIVAKDKGAVFVMKIGGALTSGERHDGRAPDYDDWDLNGDIIVYYPVLDLALELSSMGIRVDEESLVRQLQISGCMDRAELPFQKALINKELPYTIGGGIGQSRICMFFLRKAHIGEVQSSVWPQEIIEEAERNGLPLL